MDVVLYPKQSLALKTEANEILYGGAAGGGKSYLIRIASIILAINIPGLHIYIFRRTFKELTSNHLYTPGGFIELLQEFIDDKLVRFNKSDYVFEFENGSRIQLCHSQWESDIYNYQGAQIPLLIIDEATHFTEKMIRFLRSRVRLGSLKVPDEYKGMLPRIIYASNPGGVSHRYFKRGFVDFGDRVHRAPADDGGMLRQFISARLQDNKVLMENDPDYADRLRGLGKAQLVEAMLSGDWSVSETAAVPNWSMKNVKPEFRVPRSWKCKRGYDYGFSAPYATLWVAISNGETATLDDGTAFCPPKGSIIVIHELYGANEYGDGLKEDVVDTAEKIYRIDQELVFKHNIRHVQPGPADNAIFNKEQGPSISEKMASKGVYWSESNKKPGSRVNGLQVLNTMVTEANRAYPERPCFYVMEHCVNTIDQIPHLELDEKNFEDVNTESEDHIYDVVRYLVLDIQGEIEQVKYQGF